MESGTIPLSTEILLSDEAQHICEKDFWTELIKLIKKDCAYAYFK